MATSLTTSLPKWLAGCTYDAASGNDLRNSDITAAWLDTGILSGSSVGVWAGVTSGAALKVSAATGMTVTAGPGSFVVPNTASAIAGGYESTLVSSGTLTVAVSDPTNPRIDLVVAFVSDVGSSSSFGAVEIITGTPASSPGVPSAPANSVSLAQVTVPANATSIVLGNIADVRTFTAAAGGIVIAPKTGAGALPAGYNGLLCFDPATGTFYHMSAAGARQPKVRPFTPVHVVRNSNFTMPLSASTMLTATVATDGNTDLKITWHVRSITTTGANPLGFRTSLDSTLLDITTLQATGALSAGGLGTTQVIYTSSVDGTTPAAGTHTITLQPFAGASGATIQTSGTSQAAYLRVEPVEL